MSSLVLEPKLSDKEMKNLLKNKANIEITDDISVTLDPKEEKEIKITLKNNGNYNQVLKKCEFSLQKKLSQLSLDATEKNDTVPLFVGGEITYVIKCTAKYVGDRTELIIFKFEKFKIGRQIKIKVNSINYNKLQEEDEAKGYNKCGSTNLQSIIPQTYEDGMYIKGIKPYKPARFIRVRPVTWKIPPTLWSTIELIIDNKKTRTEAEYALQSRVPCLDEPLSFNNYKKRFDHLLYLEEIALVLNIRRFDLDDVVMHKNGDFLCLDVPGLAEKRPSLIIGDRIVVNFKWEKGKLLKLHHIILC